MADLHTLLDRRHEHWLLASMLLVLHATLDAGSGSALSRALMTAHLGLFFLWQPIWQKDQRLQPRAAALIVAFIAAMLAALDWWIIFAWLIVLVGIVAGRSFSTRRERYVYMLSLAFLIAELLVNCAAMLFLGAPLPAAIDGPFRIGLYLLPLLLYAIPPIMVPPREPFPVDFFRGITFALMTALLAVLSALLTYRLHIDYPLALFGTLLALGVLLLFLSWLTTPGTSGIGLLAVWEKSVLNIGTPFEAWLGGIANLAARRAAADDFLAAAIDELGDIPWISGVAWRTAAAAGEIGQRTRHRLDLEVDGITVTLYAERNFSSALLAHCRLLIQVLGHFYGAKQRENKEASEAHLRALYETGARVTHDIKNLLQSLSTMASALETATTPAQIERGYTLLRQRLPDVARRLQRALDKLERPSRPGAEHVTAQEWWVALQTRTGGSGVQLEAELTRPERTLPRDCFDSVVDNLLDNVAHKIAAGRAQRAHVRLVADDRGVTCTVSDDGAAIPAALVGRLFHEPVASDTGYGIGLFQAARQAQLAGCELSLDENRAGAVRFSIRYGEAARQVA